MATFSPSYGTLCDLAVTNLHSLADAAYWQSAGFDNSSKLGLVCHIFVTLVTNSDAGDAAGFANVYIAGSEDGGTDYAGGASGTESAYAPDSDAAAHAPLLRQIAGLGIDASDTASRTYEADIEVPVTALPKHFSIVIQNESGAALEDQNNAVEVMFIQGSSA